MRSKTSKSIIIAGIAAFAGLAALPSTGWLVRQQFRILAGGSTPGSESNGSAAWHGLNARESAVAAANPTDFDLQLAWALRGQEIRDAEQDQEASANAFSPAQTTPLRSKRLLALLPLREKFSGRAEMQAALLRSLCSGDFKIGRSEENILLTPTQREGVERAQKQRGPDGVRPATTPEAIKLTEDAASRGEALDPQNGFFPTLLAAALLAEHKDSEAFATLARAASKPQWNDYAAEEAKARTALLVAANGAEPGGIARGSITASTLLPHFAVVRDEARAMTALAVQREISGDREGGFEIRRSLARIGAAMRAERRSYICSLVGIAITSITSQRPGGAPTTDNESSEKDEARAAKLESRYVAYLTQIGHPEEATWFVAERAASERVREICNLTIAGPNDFMRPYVVLCACWAVGLFVLSSLGLTLGLGGLGAFLSRTRRVQLGAPLHRGIIFGVASTLQVPIFFAFGKSLFGDRGVASIAGPLALMEGLAFGVLFVFLARKMAWRQVRNNVGVVLATFCSSLAVLAFAVWMGDRLAEPLKLLQGMYGCVDNSSAANTSELQQAVIGLIAFSAPIVATIVFAVRSRRRRIPVSAGIVRGFRTISLPAAGVLLLAYFAICGVTLLQESTIRQLIDHQLAGEGEYYGGQIGVEWPGPVSVPGTTIPVSVPGTTIKVGK